MAGDGLMTSPQKAKGDKYERDLAKLMDNVLFGGRGQVFRAPLSGGGRNIGGGGRADLSGTPDVWVEAKRTERFQPYEAMAQAERGIAASRTTDMPVVISRRSRITDANSLVVMRMSDWLNLYGAYLVYIGHDIPDPTDPLDELHAILKTSDDADNKVVAFSPRNTRED
jgi:hypothetical protein